MALKQKDLLGMRGLAKEDILEILETAAQLKPLLKSNNKKTPHLAGKSIVTLFYENSTRTRMSFELASKYMSAAAANISVATSSVAKGETLLDTGRTLDAMGTDVIIIRHPMAGAPHLLARHVSSCVINAGDGMNEHPTQSLLDMFTIQEKLGTLSGLNVAIVGDILHSRVARSNIWALNTMGSNVTLAAPETLIPTELAQLGVRVAPSVDEAIANADVVMALRIQTERQKSGLFPSVSEYNEFYGVSAACLQAARPEALLMHPGPMNRGVEINSDIADGDQSVIQEQVTNGVAVRMAILYLLTRTSGGKQ